MQSIWSRDVFISSRLIQNWNLYKNITNQSLDPFSLVGFYHYPLLWTSSESNASANLMSRGLYSSQLSILFLHSHDHVLYIHTTVPGCFWTTENTLSICVFIRNYSVLPVYCTVLIGFMFNKIVSSALDCGWQLEHPGPHGLRPCKL